MVGVVMTMLIDHMQDLLECRIKLAIGVGGARIIVRYAIWVGLGLEQVLKAVVEAKEVIVVVLLCLILELRHKLL